MAHLGRIGAGGGVNIALRTVEAVGGRLVVAGQGRIAPDQILADRPISDYVEFVGLVGPDRRKGLLARAKATLTSVFVERFCGVHVESMLSGTPVITSGFGAFAESCCRHCRMLAMLSVSRRQWRPRGAVRRKILQRVRRRRGRFPCCARAVDTHPSFANTSARPAGPLPTAGWTDDR